MPEETQRQYEITFILSPELEEKELDSFEQEIEKSIKNLGGNIKKKIKPEKRNLSYPIKKFQSGYYLITNFLFGPEKLEELYSILKHKKEILRYIITLVPEETSIDKTQIKKKVLETKKIRKEAEEISEKEIETLKKPEKKAKPKLEDIDKKLDEILGI